MPTGRSRCAVFALVVAASVGATPAVAAAASAADVTEAPAYERVAPSPDGIGKRYMGREISAVMGWQGAAWLERSEREAEERTDLLLAELRLGPGMRVADVGAGTGYIARRVARAVGPTGRVDAVDVQPEMVAALARLAAREGLAQIRPVQGAAADVGLDNESVDLAILVDVYHELEFPREVLASVVRAVRRGGHVVFVEYRGEDPRVPIKPLHKMTVAQLRREASVHPLVLERVAETLPWQHIVVFRRR